MADKIFIDGVMFKLPREGAPDFVVGSLSINMPKLIAWYEQNVQKDWINGEIKIGRSGKPYVEQDTWEPKIQEGKPEPAPEAPAPDFDDDLPF